MGSCIYNGHYYAKILFDKPVNDSKLAKNILLPSNENHCKNGSGSDQTDGKNRKCLFPQIRLRLHRF